MTVAAGGRRYEDAVRLLNSLQTNASILESIRKSGGRLNARALPEMRDYLRRIGYQPSDLDRLGIIHIAGTKGKGSTAAFTSAILTNLSTGSKRLKVGLYTSPHLMAVRERIKIHGESLTEEAFAKYFFDVWDRLEAEPSKDAAAPSKPVYFRYVTLMAFHAFLQEEVDAVVLEVGVGGEYDSTNIVERPCVTGISALGIDHVAVLGDNLTDIAWHKAGIFKLGVPAYSVPQPDEAMKVLHERAKAMGTRVETCVNTPELSAVRLGLAGKFQYGNAALAVALAKAYLQSRPEWVQSGDLPSAFLSGLENVKWPGRCQTLEQGDVSWFLDGAHTVESLAYCLDWYLAAARTDRFLIFNCTSGRDGVKLISAIRDNMTGKAFQQVIFCTNVTYSTGQSKSDLTSHAVSAEALQAVTVQQQLSGIWRDTFEDADVRVVPAIEDAVRLVQGAAGGGRRIDALVTGSLHLVGGTLEVLRWSP